MRETRDEMAPEVTLCPSPDALRWLVQMSDRWVAGPNPDGRPHSPAPTSWKRHLREALSAGSEPPGDTSPACLVVGPPCVCLEDWAAGERDRDVSSRAGVTGTRT